MKEDHIFRSNGRVQMKGTNLVDINQDWSRLIKIKIRLENIFVLENAGHETDCRKIEKRAINCDRKGKKTKILCMGDRVVEE